MDDGYKYLSTLAAANNLKHQHIIFLPILRIHVLRRIELGES